MHWPCTTNLQDVEFVLHLSGGCLCKLRDGNALTDDAGGGDLAAAGRLTVVASAGLGYLGFEIRICFGFPPACDGRAGRYSDFEFAGEARDRSDLLARRHMGPAGYKGLLNDDVQEEG